ncbi:dienelactone hydrolase family protein, partial [Myxococcota bacterium]|nr:dienelactone hydrolase family protein [Myxococcota bacterium]
MRFALLTLATLTALGAAPRPARAQPELRGPHAFERFEAGDVDAAGTAIPTVVYYPTDTTAPVPVVAVVHGFLRNGSFMAELARTLASHGLVAVVPDMPCGARGCDHDANGRQISALLDWAEVASTDPAVPFAGRVDGTRRGALGHSWGGLGVFVAASQDPRFSSVLMLDPNDDRGLAASIAPVMPHATAHVMAESFGNCNATQWTTTVFPLTPGPHLRVRVVGSGHCDVEDPSDRLCPLACGSGDPSTTPTFRRYAVAWTLCNLTADPAMAAWIGGASLDGDVAAGVIDQVDALGLDALPCRGGAPRDAGV